MDKNMNAWRKFRIGLWAAEIDLRDFIQTNYTSYCGDGSFLSGPSKRSKLLNKKYKVLQLEEEKNGVLGIDTTHVSSLLSYKPGYLDQKNEIIFGFQTSKPLVRGVNPFGGIRLAEQSCESYGYHLSDKIKAHFEYKTTHNDGVFRAYTHEMKNARKSGIITGLPDAYGRGRIIGDYRRVALYGVDFLIEQKKCDLNSIGKREMDAENVQLCEEVFRQIDFLRKLKTMASEYQIDISAPANNALEATQWLYFAYLAAIKEQNGAAMSLGRVSTFLDIYICRDMEEGTLDEHGAQEIIDQLVLKLRMARQLRTPEYNSLFAGDPMWITESIGGIGDDGRPLVTKSSFRFIHTLYNLTPAPEPNLTVLWSDKLPTEFINFCSKASIDTDSIQYENDEIMRPTYGDDYAIACCVSAMKVGKQMQFFGARCNLAKLLLMALNGGRDEVTGVQIGPTSDVLSDDILDYSVVSKRFELYMEWLCHLYVNTMNVIHFMHDKYAYEKIQMALHDTDVERFMAFGIAGLSVVADSLSAIKYAKVTPLRNETGLITDFRLEGEFPFFGNDDDRVDELAQKTVHTFISNLRKHKTYRNAVHTLSILTITSNVVYGEKTGSTPDGRKAGEPFAPGANPMHGREIYGALASLNSVSKLPYQDCRDGISCTFTLTPRTLGRSQKEQISNLSSLMKGYFSKKAHHLNVNVLDREQLEHAIEHPELYPNLTIRISGYAVRFNSLSKTQQREVIARTFHDKL